MNQANDCGPCARIVSRIDSTSGVFNWRTSNAQRSTSNASILQYSTCAPAWKLNVERWAFGAYLRYRVVCLLETDQHIPQTAAGLSLSAAVVFQAVVLYSRRDSGGDGAVYNSFLFQRRLRSTSAGQLVRLEQARANGIGQRDSRSQRQDLWPNLRREPRDGAVREVGSAI